ncbi:MAG: adenylosuccinate lyase [Candidatus Cloacimonadaceae bacterium]|jgi:adenylosuccinate lyase|nr:adenylosuccinate lyase [Candidatus Cloacimonadota bacterium]MDY0128249.1 adenylosuccinate lyase [Candidatus Cloacimonadaceae bacterium]MCB5254009.1 adenylosuccinate lyase [Candidatus Cloacimonadota bacterium]MCK9178690.1 adenylosuccinate lyase [Candidatus Cloacimonadota bacterium]MCK9243405.1 adenylosuccinate lyase [Candidatus Cloacimonadota bacterium]
MIPRYTLVEMERIWTLENRYRCWLDVELAAAQAMHDMGIIPTQDYQIIAEKADFDVERIAEIELETRHDVIAFLTSVAEYVGPASRWVHYGMTSSDVLDTATALQLKQAGELILSELYRLAETLKLKAREHRHTLCMGRSHGIHAEPTSFGLKFALWYDETNRNIQRLKEAIRIVSVGQISGAVGNYAHLDPEVEERTCKLLELSPVNISTQVIQRDRHAQFLFCIAQIGSTLEKIALEIRHLQRTEVGEAEENFSSGQKGSSAMPHKRNPILSEQLCGLSRILRANAAIALENNPLWHERDISHSSVERIILPDSCILIHYMLVKSSAMIESLVVYPEKMMKNIELTGGLVFSQALLLHLTNTGMSREQGYALVQAAAMKSINDGEDFMSLILASKQITDALSEQEIRQIFSYSRYLKNVDQIYRRCGII